MDPIEFKEKINRDVRTKGIVMSRVPTQTKEMFTHLADSEYCGDYGLCLKSVLDGYLMWKLFFENTNMKLDVALDKLDSIVNLVNKEEIKEEKPVGRKMLNGRTE